MSSTRARLTVSYALVLLGTMVVFGVAVWELRAIGARQQLAQEAYRVADNVLLTIQNAQAALTRMTYVDSTSGPTPVVKGTKELAAALDPLAGYFMVLDQSGKLLSVRGRSVAVGPNISWVVAALPQDLAMLPAQLVLGTIIVVAPIIFVISMIVAYLVVGNAFRPVDQLINEVEAITDGRSLHRRLPADASNDELARLSQTVNAMLSRLESSFAALRRFTADASHELKTPLTVLRADVERSMHPSTNRTERMVALEEALQETARMSDLVDSLLTLARADEGRFDLHRTPIELEPLVREVFETAVILGEEGGLTLSLSSMENGVV